MSLPKEMSANTFKFINNDECKKLSRDELIEYMEHVFSDLSWTSYGSNGINMMSTEQILAAVIRANNWYIRENTKRVMEAIKTRPG